MDKPIWLTREWLENAAKVRSAFNTVKEVARECLRLDDEVDLWHKAFKLPNQSSKEAIDHLLALVRDGDNAAHNLKDKIAENEKLREAGLILHREIDEMRRRHDRLKGKHGHQKQRASAMQKAASERSTEGAELRSARGEIEILLWNLGVISTIASAESLKDYVPGQPWARQALADVAFLVQKLVEARAELVKANADRDLHMQSAHRRLHELHAAQSALPPVIQRAEKAEAEILDLKAIDGPIEQAKSGVFNLRAEVERLTSELAEANRVCEANNKTIAKWSESYEEIRLKVLEKNTIIRDQDKAPEWMTEDWLATMARTPGDNQPLAREILRLRAEVSDWIAANEDKKRLVRDLDMAWNGAGAAAQASLCDVVAQITREVPQLRAAIRDRNKFAASELERLHRDCFDESGPLYTMPVRDAVKIRAAELRKAAPSTEGQSSILPLVLGDSRTLRVGTIAGGAHPDDRRDGFPAELRLELGDDAGMQSCRYVRHAEGASAGVSAGGCKATGAQMPDNRGLHGKFLVERTDGSSAPGGKHHDCEYFVLDMTHDPHAVAAVLAYAADCREARPDLSADLIEKWGKVAGAAAPASPSTNALIQGVGDAASDWCRCVCDYREACRTAPEDGSCDAVRESGRKCDLARGVLDKAIRALAGAAPVEPEWRESMSTFGIDKAREALKAAAANCTGEMFGEAAAVKPDATFTVNEGYGYSDGKGTMIVDATPAAGARQPDDDPHMFSSDGRHHPDKGRMVVGFIVPQQVADEVRSLESRLAASEKAKASLLEAVQSAVAWLDDRVLSDEGVRILARLRYAAECAGGAS